MRKSVLLIAFSGLFFAEIVHAGSGNFNSRGPFGGFPSTAYTMDHIGIDLNILSRMANTWLPRDNRGGK
jgi:hypothetical protein